MTLPSTECKVDTVLNSSYNRADLNLQLLNGSFLITMVLAQFLLGALETCNQFGRKESARKEPQNDSYIGEGLDGTGVKHSRTGNGDY